LTGPPVWPSWVRAGNGPCRLRLRRPSVLLGRGLDHPLVPFAGFGLLRRRQRDGRESAFSVLMQGS